MGWISGVRFFIAAGHDSRAAAGSRFPAGNPHAVEVNPRFLAAFAAAPGIAKVGIAAVDDDVSLIERERSWSIMLSTGAPAMIMSMILRGRLREARNSSSSKKRGSYREAVL